MFEGKFIWTIFKRARIPISSRNFVVTNGARDACDDGSCLVILRLKD
jgi:hypothetical protein